MISKVLEKGMDELIEETCADTCIHHWVIEPPEGPVSKGVCRKCGQERQFDNYMPHSVWESENARGRGYDIEAELGNW